MQCHDWLYLEPIEACLDLLEEPLKNYLSEQEIERDQVLRVNQRLIKYDTIHITIDLSWETYFHVYLWTFLKHSLLDILRDKVVHNWIGTQLILYCDLK